MITKRIFDKKLCESAELLIFSKKQTDLFLIFQTSAITYRQLTISGLHGTSQTAARRALKRLEESGHLQSKSLRNSNEKYYFLTPAGRALIQSTFSKKFLEEMKISRLRLPSSGSQQILHRIRANDFYFSYLSYQESIPRLWSLEHPLPGKSTSSDTPARCDALFVGDKRMYYIEQDNNSQSEAIIKKKLLQYANSGLFDTECSAPSLLIFCLSFPNYVRASGTAPFSIYRLLLKFCKIWQSLEGQHGIPLDSEQFVSALEASSLSSTVSCTEMHYLKGLLKKHPEADSFSAFAQLKNSYLALSQRFTTQSIELDAFYQKRLKSHFTALQEHFAFLAVTARHGNPLFVVPNHRLKAILPFILTKELNLSQKLQMYLFHNGLILDDWIYCSPLKISLGENHHLYFFAGFHHPTFGYLAIEIPYHDLNALTRIKHNMKYITQQNLSLICFNAPGFFNELQELCQKNSWNKKCNFLIADIFQALNGPPSENTLYQSLDDATLCPIYFECDLFDSKLHIIKKEEYR